MVSLCTRQAIHTMPIPNPACRSITQGETANKHWARMKQLSQDANYIIMYTDRFMEEKERNLYFSMVTGTHYRTMTPPGQQPTYPCAEDRHDKSIYSMFTGMMSRVHCLVVCLMWTLWVVFDSDISLGSPMGSLGSFVFGMPCFS